MGTGESIGLTEQIADEAVVLAEMLAASPEALRALVHGEPAVIADAAAAHGVSQNDNPDSLAAALSAEPAALERILAAEPVVLADAARKALGVLGRMRPDAIEPKPELLVHLLAAEAATFES